MIHRMISNFGIGKPQMPIIRNPGVQVIFRCYSTEIGSSVRSWYALVTHELVYVDPPVLIKELLVRHGAALAWLLHWVTVVLINQMLCHIPVSQILSGGWGHPSSIIHHPSLIIDCPSLIVDCLGVSPGSVAIQKGSSNSRNSHSHSGSSGGLRRNASQALIGVFFLINFFFHMLLIYIFSLISLTSNYSLPAASLSLSFVLPTKKLSFYFLSFLPN